MCIVHGLGYHSGGISIYYAKSLNLSNYIFVSMQNFKELMGWGETVLFSMDVH